MLSIRRRVRVAAAATETELLWRSVEPAHECGPGAVTHNKWWPPQFGEHA